MRPSNSLFRARAVCLSLAAALCLAAPSRGEETDADRRLRHYFEDETSRLQDACLRGVASLEQWEAGRERLRQQLLEMLGLSPLPEKTPLQPTVGGVIERDDFVVENVHFQSRPGLYVTGNLYRPRNSEGPLPAVLYVCGHARVKIDGVSYGNKANYQHHGAWFARRGYVCLTIDTLQLGEIEGIHHGTYSHNRWWWLTRGYTPAGVEAWNCVRALDYLQSRPEVDGERIGVTGRSGGGAYSWWIAAIDDRIKAAVPVAGITDLRNHVVDGCVEGHCDCMYMVNTYRWDYPLVAALVAPRPLLISNTDRDPIFPLEGVVRTHRLARRVYRLYGKEENLALHITAGPHRDTQELRVHAFRWLNHHLRGDDSPIQRPAEKLFQPPQLRALPVGAEPVDEINTTVDQTFVPLVTESPVPADEAEWNTLRQRWLRELRKKSFRGWPVDAPPPSFQRRHAYSAGKLRVEHWEFESQPHVRLPLITLRRDNLKQPELTVLNVLGQQGWDELQATLVRLAAGADAADDRAADAESLRSMLLNQPWMMAYLAPRGIGPDAWSGNEKKQTQIRRRFYLLGQSLDGMRVWDVRRAAATLRGLDRSTPLWLQAEGSMSGIALMAAAFDDYGRVDLHDVALDDSAPAILNRGRILTIPETLALAAQRSRVVLYGADADDWRFPRQLGESLGWPEKRIQFR